MDSAAKFVRKAMPVLLLLYVVALHTSIAGMEILSWLMVLCVVVIWASRRTLPHFAVWLPLAALAITVVIGLELNTAGRGFWFQFGFLRWTIVLYTLFVTLSECWNPQFEKRLVQVWSVILVISALYALFQTLTGIDLIRPSANVVAYQGYNTWRPVGFFSRSLAFAYSFGVSFLALVLPRLKSSPKWAGISLAILGVLTIIATDSRGAWLALIVAGFLYFAVARPRYLLYFSGVLAAFIYSLVVFHNGLAAHFNLMVHWQQDGSTTERLHLWQAYTAMWKDHPWFGIGLLQGDVNLPAYYARLGIQEEFVSHAHNVYLQWLAGSGVIGLALYLWICVYFLALAWRLRNSTPWGWSLFLAQIFLHVGALTENNFFTAITNHMVMFCWAILLMLTWRASTTSSIAQQNTSI